MSFVAEDEVMGFVEAMVIEVSRATTPERPIQCRSRASPTTRRSTATAATSRICVRAWS